MAQPTFWETTMHRARLDSGLDGLHSQNQTAERLLGRLGEGPKAQAPLIHHAKGQMSGLQLQIISLPITLSLPPSALRVAAGSRRAICRSGIRTPSDQRRLR